MASSSVPQAFWNPQSGSLANTVPPVGALRNWSLKEGGEVPVLSLPPNSENPLEAQAEGLLSAQPQSSVEPEGVIP